MSRFTNAKAYGYKVEARALGLLRRLYPTMRRQGSLGYTLAAADLVDETQRVGVQCKGRATTLVGSWFRALSASLPPGWRPLLVVQDKRFPPLVVMKLEDYVEQAESWQAGVASPAERPAHGGG